MLVAYQREVYGQPVFVRIVFAADGHRVRNATRAELDEIQLAHFYRAIDQFRIVRRMKITKPPFADLFSLEPGRQPPMPRIARWRRNADTGRLPLLAMNAQEYIAAVKKSVARVQMGATHRTILGINLVTNDQRAIYRCALPGRFVEFFDADAVCTAVRGKSGDMAGKIPNQVTARHPRRQ